MIASAIVFPGIDPVIFSVGPFSVHWYAMSYVAGVLLGWWYLHYLNKIEPVVFTPKALDDIIVWAIFGIILGGRAGYVIFYNGPYYLSHPEEIGMIWRGGMSFHGGLLGVILAIILFCRRFKIKFWPTIDLVACVTPIGLGLGRIANFINAELYGRATDAPWGVIFPSSMEPRHPSQLYEAFMEGILLLIIMYLLVHFTKAKQKPGVLSGFFLVGYSFFRSIAELFREPDAQIGFISSFGFTMGQLLSFPMMLFGIYLILRNSGNKKRI